ncbi:MAG: Holliday junction branch migration protein RuvA [Hyphomicrobiales bacterium]
MYSYISGKLVEKNPTHVIIDVHGIGYFIHVSLNTYSQLGDKENVKLYTHFVVKEDAHALFGFSSEKEKTLFQHLITVSGVGANTARLILSSLTPEEIYNAIVNEKVKTLQSVKGIGGKTAQRIVLDLKDKMKKEDFIQSEFNPQTFAVREEALAGLLVLGFNKNAVSKTLDKLLKNNGAMTVEELIKEALKLL